jgi:ribonucleoside-diphosphate reductase beta chain
MSTLFTASWVSAWADALRASDSYRIAARRWEGGVVLETQAAPAHGVEAARAVYLDLWHGECRGAGLAGPEEYAAAAYVLRGSFDTWLQVLRGDLAPTMAIMRGKLTLAKGSLAGLLPHVQAAGELVRVAQGVVVTTGVALADKRSSARSEQATPADGAAASDGTASAPNGAAARDGTASTHDGAATDATSSRRREGFRTTGQSGLRFDSFPMRLWDKAKRLGTWNPAEIDFTQDRADWERLRDDERDLLLRLATLFQAGEEAVALDIVPLVDVIGQEGRLEEQLYLTSFLWEEAKHVELFRRFLDAVMPHRDELAHYHTPSYHAIFTDALPAAMGRLRSDRSPLAQAEASATYNMIVEGVLAETGYHVYHRVLVANGILPGMQRASGLLKADESRHIAYGVYLLARLVAEHGDPVWRAITARMEALLEPAIAVIGEAFAAYPPDAVPFGLRQDVFVEFAMGQFRKRMARLELARAQGAADLLLADLEEFS